MPKAQAMVQSACGDRTGLMHFGACDSERYALRVQFRKSDINFGSPMFGVISSTSVSARVGQLALKFAV